jgi:tetratricopeptide (TPR) repeat protein
VIRDDKDIENLLAFTTDIISSEGFDEAKDALLKQLEQDPENMEAMYTLGVMYAKRLDYEKALKYLVPIEKSKSEFIHLNQVQKIIAYIYAMQGKYVESKEMLLKVLEFAPEDIISLSILSYVFYKAKLYEQALKFYQKAVKVDPENAKLLNNIGFILIETGLNVEKGMEYVRKALRLKPEHPSYLDSLGWGYYMQSDYEKAVETLRKAFELAPNAKEIKEHIREILNITGQQE